MHASGSAEKQPTNWAAIALAILVAGLVIVAGTWSYMHSLSSDPRTDAERLTQNITVSMQKKFDENPALIPVRLRVTDVSIVKKSGNEWAGIASIKTGWGESRDIAISVIADGDTGFWETGPGALMFFPPAGYQP